MPEFFDGENQDAVEWIQAFNRIAKLNEWTDKQKILYMEISMKNRGLEWLETYEPPVTGDSYDARYQSFTNYFGKNAVVLQAEFLKCAQNPNESSKLYAERFIKLTRCAGTSMNEKEKAMKFTIGLLPRLRKEVLRHAPSSVAAALQLCEANELADAFDQIDITSDNNTVLTLNNIDRVKDNNKVNNNNNNNNKNLTLNKPANQPPKPDPLKNIDEKLDKVVNVMTENTRTIGQLTVTLQDTYLQSTAKPRARIDQQYALPTAQQNLNNNRSSYYGRPGIWCNFCQRHTLSHGTEGCFSNPNNPNYQNRLGNAASAPAQASVQYSSQQDVRVQPAILKPNNQQSSIQVSQQPLPVQTMSTELRTQAPPSNTGNTSQLRHMGTITVTKDDRFTQAGGRLFTAEGSIAGINIDKVLIDTGAAVSAISLSYFKKLPHDIRTKVNRDHSTKIMTANKKQMEIVGNINLDIQLGSA